MDNPGYIIMSRLASQQRASQYTAQNLANADTPGYRASDLKGFDFKGILNREPMQVNMTVTADNQMGGRRRRLRDFTEVQDRTPYETAPAGNAVDLEEQMMKISDSQVKHRLATELYKKQIHLLRTAIGK